MASAAFRPGGRLAGGQPGQAQTRDPTANVQWPQGRQGAVEPCSPELDPVPWEAPASVDCKSVSWA